MSDKLEHLLDWIYDGKIPDGSVAEPPIVSAQRLDSITISLYQPPEVPPITDSTFAAHVVIAGA